MSTTERDDWFDDNDAFLSASLQWVRLRLMRLALANNSPTPPPSSPPVFTEPAPAKPDRKAFSWLGRSTQSQPTGPKLLLPATNEGFDQRLIDAAAKVKEAASAEPPPALVQLARRFGLSEFERNVLLLCMGMELDGELGQLCAQAQGDPSRHWPTFGLALTLFDDPAWDVLSPERPLRSWRLVEINQPGTQPLTASALRADERIVNYVKGLNYLDDRFAPLITTFAAVDQPLPPSQEFIVQAIVHALRSQSGNQPLVHLLGPDASSKQSVAARVCQILSYAVVRITADLLPANPPEMENLARLWQRESVLLPVALYLDANDAGKELPAVNRFLSRMAGVVFLDTRESLPSLAPDALTFDVSRPTRTEQRSAWIQVLEPGNEQIAQDLAAQFNFELADIRRIARLSAASATPTAGDLWERSLVASRPRLDALAQRIEPKADRDALIIADSESKLLDQIVAQVRSRFTVYDDWGFVKRMNRGMGLSALFAGESGTGKTMAAEVISKQLRLNLYRIDLSAVVSKYIGETEKNLRRVFDAAEDGGTILFFDEADALFGKRSEVKDSHDRYANIEVNYLLQRMEAYRGLAILATNMKSALDLAFVRRLRFIVNFAFPGPVERRRIWEKAFPAETPLARLDLDRLARFNFTGASIHSVALNAAFLAAARGGSVTMPLILEAARSEFRKLDKPLNEADFRWTDPKETAA